MPKDYSGNYDDPLQNSDASDLQSRMLALSQARGGFYAPPPMQPVQPTAPIAAEPTGFGWLARKGLQALDFATSGEKLGNLAGSAFGNDQFGTNVGAGIESGLGGGPVGKSARFIVDTATSPLTLGTLGAGAAYGGVAKGATLAAEGIGSAATGKLSEMAARGAGLPEPLVLAAGLAGGFVGGGTAKNLITNMGRNAGGLLPEEIAALAKSEKLSDRIAAVLSQADVDSKLAAKTRSETLGKASGLTASQSAGKGTTEFENILYSNLKKTGAETPEFKYTGDPVSAEDVATLHRDASNYFRDMGPHRQFDAGTVGLAIDNMLLGNKLPVPSEIKLMRESLGVNFAEVVGALSKNPSKLETLLSITGISRAVMSAYDLSVPFRQGILATSHKEFWTSLGPMVKAMASPKYARMVEEDLATSAHPMDALARQRNLFSSVSKLGPQEDGYIRSFADAIPGVMASGRASTTFLSKLRSDLGRSWYKTRTELANGDLSKMPTAAEMESKVSWIGIMTGKGELPEWMAKNPTWVTVMNQLAFSPQLMSARLAAINPRSYYNMPASVRKEAITDMAKFIGMGTAALGTAGMAAKSGILGKDVQVGLNPFSSDFGKIIIGNTREDLWGGFQPYARYAAQVSFGSKVNSIGDYETDNSISNRLGMVGNFGRGKLAPLPSFIVDALMGTTFTGQEVDVTSGQGLSRAAAERLTPMFLQDLANGINSNGWRGALAAAPGLVGVGTQTYNSVNAILGKAAQDVYHKPFNTLTQREQAELKQLHAEEIALQSPPDTGVAGAIYAANNKLMSEQQRLSELFRSKQMTNADFTDMMNQAAHDHGTIVQAAIASDPVQRADPTNGVLNKWYALRDQAAGPTGVDYEKLDQLRKDYEATLSPSDLRYVTERTTSRHAPEVQWWFDAKKTIESAGYYNANAVAMDKFAPLLRAVGAEGLTYDELEAKMLTATNYRDQTLLQSVIKRIDQQATQVKQSSRRADPALDKALTLVYGSKPLNYANMTR